MIIQENFSIINVLNFSSTSTKPALHCVTQKLLRAGWRRQLSSWKICLQVYKFQNKFFRVTGRGKLLNYRETPGVIFPGSRKSFSSRKECLKYFFPWNPDVFKFIILPMMAWGLRSFDLFLITLSLFLSCF